MQRINLFFISTDKIDRSDLILIGAVKELGDRADGDCSHLEIETVHFDINDYIKDYDEKETLYFPS